jgi:hypothetical protein
MTHSSRRKAKEGSVRTRPAHQHLASSMKHNLDGEPPQVRTWGGGNHAAGTCYAQTNTGVRAAAQFTPHRHSICLHEDLLAACSASCTVSLLSCMRGTTTNGRCGSCNKDYSAVLDMAYQRSACTRWFLEQQRSVSQGIPAMQPA